jgi:chromatin remodeling complex protein RSC6
MANKPGGRSGALMRPVQPDDTLAAIVGSNPQPRTEITKKVWDHIKANDLQDPKNRRVIRADAKLRPLFDGESEVDMFELTRKVNKHIKS